MPSPQPWFLGSWSDLLRIMAVGAATYAAIVFLLRLFGNRSLAKTASFDHVVTVALGSVLATGLLSKDTTWAGGTVALGLLLGLQFAIARLITRLPWLERVFIQGPQVLVYEGRLREEAMRQARLTVADVHSALRKAGVAHMESAALVVIESDGTFSVIRREGDAPVDVVEGIREQLR